MKYMKLTSTEVKILQSMEGSEIMLPALDNENILDCYGAIYYPKLAHYGRKFTLSERDWIRIVNKVVLS